MTEEKGLQTSSQILIYQAEDGQTKIEVQLQEDTVWLAQKHMAELFQTSKQNIGQHLKNIFAEGELNENSVVKKFFTTAADGKKYQTLFYNLDAIISVGYRIKSHVATRFRPCGCNCNTLMSRKWFPPFLLYKAIYGFFACRGIGYV